LVFAIKAALLPLHFWLPSAYANAPAPVAALFAIMTKVGAYAILRMFTLVFGPDVAATTGLSEAWLLPAALLTLIAGAIGVLGSKKIGRVAAFGAIASMGTLLIAISLFTETAAAAALYYLVHSTLAAALLFLVADLVVERQGPWIFVNKPMAQTGLISALFFAAAIALTGMPPLSGFLGKLLVLDATRGADLAAWIWSVILVGSLITIIGMARAGSILFWKGHGLPSEELQAPGDSGEAAVAERPAQLPFVACFALLGGLVALTVFAGPATHYAEATAAQLYAPAEYIEAVLGKEAQ
ncbi:MAG: proton-conducting transporter membrane subunit, partial [Leisingera sp.]